jgi:signal transduction histidine kinase
MTEQRARRLAWSAFILWVLFFVSSVALDLATKRVLGQGPGSSVLFTLSTIAFPIVAILILARQPRNTIGWILMAIGLAWAFPLGTYGTFAISRGLPGGVVAAALSAPMWAPPIVLMGTSLLLRFPNGRLLSPRWRKVEVLAAFALVVTMVAIVIAPGDLTDSGYPNLRNPLGIEALRSILEAVLPVILLIPLTILASAFSLVRRFRRSTGTERLQLKWLTTAAATVALLYLVAMIASIEYAWESVPGVPAWVRIVQNAAVTSFALIPIAIGFAILKYRLYDIDLVINKTVVYGAMAAFITAVYVAIVAGIGQAIGSRDNLALSILATAVVAVAFQPVRERVQRLANRLVYGKRATPYEVLSDFAGRMGGSYAVDDVLPRMAWAIAEGTGAERAEVLIGSGDDLHPAATWPEDAPEGEPDVVVPVAHRGEELGALSVRKPRGERLTPAEDKLVKDLASQAGLVLRNVRLLEDLRASRQRLVKAQDEERRRLERNIHDGAQQQLVALAVKVRLAETLATRDAAKATELMSQVKTELQGALNDLRDLARGIYPPLLADQGLAAALEAQARKSHLPVTVDPDGVGRYPQEVEAAVYFCTLEALQNVAKYAGASSAVVRLSMTDGELRFEVADDGVGFDPASTPRGAGLTNMSDRLEALGGSVEVRSTPGEGTSVLGRVPAPATGGPA